jgi:hypothetical protein
MPVSDVRVFDGTNWVSIKGPAGSTGAAGTAATVSVKSVVALAAGATPTVTDSNPDPSVCELNFGIPAGVAGTAATVAVGTVNGLPAGSAPTVTNSGNSAAAVLNFGLVKGDKGDPGSGVTIKGTLSGAATALPTGAAAGDMYILGSPIPTAAPNGSGGTKAEGDGIVWGGTSWANVGPIRGPAGPQGHAGAAGTSATVSVGSVTTGAPGTSAVVTDGDSTNPNNVVLNMTIPQGLKGDPGANAQVFNNLVSSPPSGMNQGAIWLVNT